MEKIDCGSVSQQIVKFRFYFYPPRQPSGSSGNCRNHGITLKTPRDVFTHAYARALPHALVSGPQSLVVAGGMGCRNFPVPNSSPPSNGERGELLGTGKFVHPVLPP